MCEKEQKKMYSWKQRKKTSVMERRLVRRIASTEKETIKLRLYSVCQKDIYSSDSQKDENSKE